MTKKLLLAVAGVLAVVVSATTLYAADFLPKDPKQAGNVVVSGSATYHNLYVAGGTVQINKKIFGDLFSAGGSVNVIGAVEKDLFAAGGNVTVLNPVGDDARLAGGNVVVNTSIGGDAVIAGGTISVGKDTTVGGDLWAAGGAITIEGTVSGKAKIMGGEVLLNGVIAGDVTVRAGKKLTFGPDARVTGAITYSGREEAVVQDGAQVGKISFTRTEQDNKRFHFARIFTIFLLVKLIALFIAGLFLLKLFHKTSTTIVSSAYSQFWANLGIGVVGGIVFPILSILLLITGVGTYVGLLLLIWFIFALLVTGIVTVFFIGSLLQKWIRKKQEIMPTWQTVLWGVLGGLILGFIPFVGWIAIWVAHAASFGAVLRTVKGKIETKS